MRALEVTSHEDWNIISFKKSEKNEEFLMAWAYMVHYQLCIFIFIISIIQEKNFFERKYRI